MNLFFLPPDDSQHRRNDSSDEVSLSFQTPAIKEALESSLSSLHTSATSLDSSTSFDDLYAEIILKKAPLVSSIADVDASFPTSFDKLVIPSKLKEEASDQYVPTASPVENQTNPVPVELHASPVHSPTTAHDSELVAFRKKLAKDGSKARVCQKKKTLMISRCTRRRPRQRKGRLNGSPNRKGIRKLRASSSLLEVRRRQNPQLRRLQAAPSHLSQSRENRVLQVREVIGLKCRISRFGRRQALWKMASSKGGSLGRLGSFFKPSSSARNASDIGIMRTLSNTSATSSRHRRSSVPTVVAEMNVFCSDMVSTDFVLSQIAEAKANPDIVKLEFEDLLESCTAEIARAIQDLFQSDGRPWKCIRFLDEVPIYAGPSSYRLWRQCKKKFMKRLGSACTVKLIPIKFSTKLIISDCAYDNDSNDNLFENDLVELLRQVQQDASVTSLQITTAHSTQCIVQELTRLFQCDNREWKSVQLHLSGECPFPKDSREHAHWCKTMKACIKEMQRVAKEQGILLPMKK